VGNEAQPHSPALPAEVEVIDEPGCSPLPSSKHEIFAQHRALTGATIAASYTQAGGTSTKNAKKMGERWAARQDVKDRIAFLQVARSERVMDNHVMSRREVLMELKTNVVLGRELKGGLNASNKALELIGGEEHGMFVQKRETKHTVDEIDDMGPEQLVAFIHRAVKKIPGLEIDAAFLAAAVGIEVRPEIGSGGITGDCPPDPGSEVPEGEGL
jgi:hypothetical protein